MMELANAVKRWREAGKRMVLATVVRTWGSSPRDVGSMMAVNEDGEIAGSVSGGCVEGSVLSAAYEMFACSEEEGSSELMTFSTADDKAWEVGLPCGGDIEVFVQPYVDDVHDVMFNLISEGVPFKSVVFLDDEEPYSGVQAVVAEDGRKGAAWMQDFILDEALEVFENQKGSFRGGVFDVMGGKVFACEYGPRYTIVCVGAVHIAACLAALAKTLDYDVVIVDPRLAFLKDSRFPEASALVNAWPQKAFAEIGLNSRYAICALTHDEKIDVPAIEKSLESDAFYIGCLGHAETLADRRRALLDAGIEECQLSRVYGPIGSYIGGRAPSEIALSILAQIQAVRYGRIDHADEMPGHRLSEFTPEAIDAIARAREERRLSGEKEPVSYSQAIRGLQ